MADSKPATGKIVPVTDKAAPKEARQGVGDPNGIITNRPDGEGTRQTEPRPEDYPASAKVASPASQINSASEQVVGEPIVQETGDDDLNAALQEAQDARGEAKAKTDERFAQQAKDDGLLK